MWPFTRENDTFGDVLEEWCMSLHTGIRQLLYCRPLFTDLCVDVRSVPGRSVSCSTWKPVSVSRRRPTTSTTRSSVSCAVCVLATYSPAGNLPAAAILYHSSLTLD